MSFIRVPSRSLGRLGYVPSFPAHLVAFAQFSRAPRAQRVATDPTKPGTWAAAVDINLSLVNQETRNDTWYFQAQENQVVQNGQAYFFQPDYPPYEYTVAAGEAAKLQMVPSVVYPTAGGATIQEPPAEVYTAPVYTAPIQQQQPTQTTTQQPTQTTTQQPAQTTTQQPAQTTTQQPAAPTVYYPRLSFENATSGNAMLFRPGDQWRLRITGGRPNAAVEVYGGKNGSYSSMAAGTSDGAGTFAAQGTIRTEDAGAWWESWSVGGDQAGSFSFSVPTTTPTTTTPATTTPTTTTETTTTDEGDIVSTPISAITEAAQQVQQQVEQAVQNAKDYPWWLWAGLAGVVYLATRSKDR